MAHILLIEDNDSIRKMLSLFLARFGHTVISARDGQEGLDLFPHSGADLVITDLMMPRKSGLEVMQALRERQARVKVIAISGGGQADEEDPLATAVSLGAFRVFRKPFSPEELMIAVNEVLAGAPPRAIAC